MTVFQAILGLLGVSPASLSLCFAVASLQAHASRAHCSIYNLVSLLCSSATLESRTTQRCFRWAGPHCGRRVTSVGNCQCGLQANC